MMATRPFIAGNAQHHFAGTLVEKHADCKLGLHRLTLRLLDDDGGSHIVYMAFGRGDRAEVALDNQYHTLNIGQRYHVAADSGHAAPDHTYWMGKAQIKPDQRRARFAPNPAPKPSQPQLVQP
jgi:hypothetical protein